MIPGWISATTPPTPTPSPTAVPNCDAGVGCTAEAPKGLLDTIVNGAKGVAQATKDGVVDAVANDPVVKAVSSAVDFASDPAGYWATTVHKSAADLTSKVLTWLYELVQPNLNAGWFLESYAVAFGLSVVMMGFMVLYMLAKAAKSRRHGPAILMALVTRVPAFMVGGMFAPAVAITLLKLAALLVDTITGSLLGMAAGDVVTNLTAAIVGLDPLGIVGGAIVGLLGSVAILLGILLVFIMLIAVMVAMLFSGAIFPLGYVWYVNPGTERTGKAVMVLWVSLIFAPSLIFLMLGIGAKIIAGLELNIADAGMKALVNVIVLAVVLFMVACSPAALLKFAPVTPWSNPTEGPEWTPPSMGSGSGSGSGGEGNNSGDGESAGGSALAAISGVGGEFSGEDGESGAGGSSSGRIAGLAGGAGDKTKARAAQGAKLGGMAGPEGAAAGAIAGAVTGAGEEGGDAAKAGVDAAVQAAAQTGDLAQESATSQVAGDGEAQDDTAGDAADAAPTESFGSVPTGANAAAAGAGVAGAAGGSAGPDAASAGTGAGFDVAGDAPGSATADSATNGLSGSKAGGAAAASYTDGVAGAAGSSMEDGGSSSSGAGSSDDQGGSVAGSATGGPDSGGYPPVGGGDTSSSSSSDGEQGAGSATAGGVPSADTASTFGGDPGGAGSDPAGDTDGGIPVSANPMPDSSVTSPDGMSWRAAGGHLVDKAAAGSQSVGDLAELIAENSDWQSEPERWA